MVQRSTLLLFGAALALLLFAPGCATTSESAEANKLAENVGIYPPPPPNLIPVRVGVPKFLDARPKEKAKASVEGLAALAADQLTTLAVNTMRFDVIERAQMEQLLKEQDLEGIVDPNELAQPGKVRGVDYLLIGKVTNFRIKTVKSSTGFNIGAIVSRVSGVHIGLADLRSGKHSISVDVGVDLRLVDPTTGSILCAKPAEYKKTDKASTFGMSLLGADAHADGGLSIGEDDQGLVLRLALDHCIRKMLPIIDQKLLQKQRLKKAEAK